MVVVLRGTDDDDGDGRCGVRGQVGPDQVARADQVVVQQQDHVAARPHEPRVLGRGLPALPLLDDDEPGRRPERAEIRNGAVRAAIGDEHELVVARLDILLQQRR